MVSCGLGEASLPCKALGWEAARREGLRSDTATIIPSCLSRTTGSRNTRGHPLLPSFPRECPISLSRCWAGAVLHRGKKEERKRNDVQNSNFIWEIFLKFFFFLNWSIVAECKILFESILWIATERKPSQKAHPECSSCSEVKAQLYKFLRQRAVHQLSHYWEFT